MVGLSSEGPAAASDETSTRTGRSGWSAHASATASTPPAFTRMKSPGSIARSSPARWNTKRAFDDAMARATPARSAISQAMS